MLTITSSKILEFFHIQIAHRNAPGPYAKSDLHNTFANERILPTIKKGHVSSQIFRYIAYHKLMGQDHGVSKWPSNGWSSRCTSLRLIILHNCCKHVYWLVIHVHSLNLFLSDWREYLNLSLNMKNKRNIFHIEAIESYQDSLSRKHGRWNLKKMWASPRPVWIFRQQGSPHQDLRSVTRTSLWI